MSEITSILALVGQLQSWLDAGRIPRPKGSVQWEVANGYIDQISQVSTWAMAQKHPGIVAIGRPLRNLADAMRAAGPSRIFCSGNVAGLGEDLPWQTACTQAERELHSLQDLLGTMAGSELPTIWHQGEQGIGGLRIVPGGLEFRGVIEDLGGKPLKCIAAFLNSPLRRVTATQLRTDHDIFGEFTDNGTIKNTISDARDALRKLRRNAGIPDDGGQYDPLPCVDSGKDLAWELKFPGELRKS